MILITTGAPGGTARLAAKQATEEKCLVVPSSCLLGLRALDSGQTGKLPRAVTALTRWHALVPQGQASGHFWKG